MFEMRFYLDWGLLHRDEYVGQRKIRMVIGYLLSRATEGGVFNRDKAIGCGRFFSEAKGDAKGGYPESSLMPTISDTPP